MSERAWGRGDDLESKRSEHRFIILLLAMVGLLIFAPIVGYLPFSDLLFPGLGALIPLTAIYAVSDNRRHMRIGLILGLPATFGAIVQHVAPGFRLDWITLLFPPVFYAFTVWIVGRRVFRARVVKLDTLVGACCVYLLIGMTWWFFYMVFESVEPGSFVGREPGLATDEARFDLLYYSFVTLTTLGFGDILPLSRGARAFTIVQAATGVLYMGIVIANLVGVYATQALHREDD